MKTTNPFLSITGWLLLVLTVFQAVISLSSTWSYYFGAGDIAFNYPRLVVMGELCAVVFGLFCIYAFSGAGYIRPLPFLRSILVLVCALFLLRGLFVVLEILINMDILPNAPKVPVRMVIASFIALGVGILCSIGTVRLFIARAKAARS